MRHAIFTFSAALAACIGLHGAAHADQLDTVKSRGVLRCGIVSNAVPFSFVADPQTRKQVGYDLDMCEEIGRTVGVKVEYSIVTIAGRIQDLLQDRIDVSASAITITPARAQQVDFSQAYFRTGVVIGVPAERAAELKNLAALAGKRISITEGGLTGAVITEKIPSARLIGFPTTANAFLALEQGKADAMAGDDTTLLGLISTSNAKYTLLPDRLSEESLGIAVRKGEKGMLDAVNQTLTAMEKSGRAQAVFDTWFGSKSKLKMTRAFRIDGQ